MFPSALFKVMSLYLALNFAILLRRLDNTLSTERYAGNDINQQEYDNAAKGKFLVIY